MIFFDGFKKSRRDVIRDNQRQGKEGEEYVRRKYEMNGYKLDKTGRGHDWKATRRDWLTGKKETIYIENKTGNSKLSELQKRKKHSLGKRYVVERQIPTTFGLVEKRTDSYSDRSNDKKSNKFSGLFGSSSYGSLLGTGSSKRSSKKSSSGLFGSSSYGSLLGTGSSKRSSKKSSSGLFGSSSYDSLLGNGSSKRRSRKKSNPSFW